MADPRSPVSGPSRPRAMSPAQAGYVQGSIAEVVASGPPNAGAESTARCLSLGMATSLAEVLALVPVDFRETLRPHFKLLKEYVERRIVASTAVSKLEKHKVNGTYPTAIEGLHTPVFQFSKNFLENGGLDTPPDAEMDALVKRCKGDALQLAEATKSKEARFYHDLCQPTVWLPIWRKAVHDQARQGAELNKRPQIVPDVNGGERITGWVTDSTYELRVKNLLEDLVQFGLRILVIEAAKEQAANNRDAAKKKLKDVADVEMGDSTPEKRVEDLVSKALGQRLRQLGITVSDPTPLLLSQTDVYLPPALGQGSRGVKRPRNQGGEEERRIRRCESQNQGNRQATSKWHLEGTTVQEATEDSRWTWSILQGRQRQRQSESVVSTSRLRYENPLSYPDEILDLPVSLAVRYLLAAASPAMVEAMRFRSDVHLGPGVELPRILSTSLSVGLRYMYHRTPLAELVPKAYKDFVERLRWRLYFMHQSAISGAIESDSSGYDPDYDLHLPRKKLAPLAEPYIEQGIDAGREFVDEYVRSSVPCITSHPDYASGLLDWRALEETLRSKGLIVTMTDKNLGVAVITKQWFIEGAHSLLDDPTQYLEVTKEECESTLRETIREVRSIAEGFDNLSGTSEQFVKFLVSKCPAPEDQGLPSVPRFYVIPKIHKKPVKHRPIIPCHSSAQAPAAKYVSKMLKPLVERCKFVLHGTKHLANKLASIRLNPKPGKKAWLVSGDVVAFYPSIPLEEAMNIVMTLFHGYYKTTLPVEEIELFERCLRLANAKNIVEFQGRFWLQTQGLAMGQAPSPDIANLWGAYFEEHLFHSNRALTDLGFAFIGRYIDDVFGIVYADSAENALKVASILRYDDPGEERVRLLWEVSERFVPFLDMLIYIDPVTGQIGHKPYQKKLNHMERIPWISHHPKDVKKGTYIGEMSRLATLSSSPEEYVSAIKSLQGLYMARGYPEKLVHTWTKDNLAERWDKRLSEPKPARPVLVLKSEFNPAWYNFNVNELGRVITGRWKEYLYSIYDHMWRTEDAAERSRHEFRPGVPLGRSIGFSSEGGTFVIDEYPVSVAKQQPLAPSTEVTPGAGGSSGSNGTDHGRLPSGSAVEIGQVKASAKWLNVGPSERPCDWLVTHYGRLTDGGSGGRSVQETIFDVNRAGLCDRRWLVSRKRTRNLFDVASAWKRSILNELDSSRDESPDYWNQVVDIDVHDMEL